MEKLSTRAQVCRNQWWKQISGWTLEVLGSRTESATSHSGDNRG